MNALFLASAKIFCIFARISGRRLRAGCDRRQNDARGQRQSSNPAFHSRTLPPKRSEGAGRVPSIIPSLSRDSLNRAD